MPQSSAANVKLGHYRSVVFRRLGSSAELQARCWVRRFLTPPGELLAPILFT